MKNLIKRLLPVLILTTAIASAEAQTLNETEQRTISLGKSALENSLHLFNITGDVKVETYAGNDIVMEIHKEFKASTESQRRRLADDLEIRHFIENGDIVIYLEAPFIETTVKKGPGSDYSIGYNTRNNNRQPNQPRYRLDFNIKVPKDIHLKLSTVTDGTVYIDGTQGTISANNVNGGIELVNISGPVHALTVNGNISASFSTHPGGDSSFNTINGKVETWFPDDFSGDIHFKSLHGDLYTDFENLIMMPAAVSIENSDKHNTNRFKIDKTTALRIGDGGTNLQFDLLNGSAYIRREINETN